MPSGTTATGRSLAQNMIEFRGIACAVSKHLTVAACRNMGTLILLALLCFDDANGYENPALIKLSQASCTVQSLLTNC